MTRRCRCGCTELDHCHYSSSTHCAHCPCHRFQLPARTKLGAWWTGYKELVVADRYRRYGE